MLSVIRCERRLASSSGISCLVAVCTDLDTVRIFTHTDTHTTAVCTDLDTVWIFTHTHTHRHTQTHTHRRCLYWFRYSSDIHTHRHTHRCCLYWFRYSLDIHTHTHTHTHTAAAVLNFTHFLVWQCFLLTRGLSHSAVSLCSFYPIFCTINVTKKQINVQLIDCCLRFLEIRRSFLWDVHNIWTSASQPLTEWDGPGIVSQEGHVFVSFLSQHTV